MLSPRWYKVLRDLWGNKRRTILVVLSIAVGVAAIGLVMQTQSIILNTLPASYLQANPASATLTSQPFDDSLVEVIRAMDGVQDAEGRNSLQIRLQTGPNEWRQVQLTVIPDFNNIGINKIWPQSGVWPPGERDLLMERASLSLIGARVGDTVLVETPDGKQREMKVAGLVHDLTQPAGTFVNQASGYINFDTLAWLGYAKSYNELLLKVSGDDLTRSQIQGVANAVRDKIEKSGRVVYSTVIPDPGKHWFETYLGPMSTILGALGILALFLSGFLVINTISALMAQQVRQIGIMKAIGARRSQIIAMYLSSVVVIGLLALLIAVPLSWLATRAAIAVLASIINFDVSEFGLMPQAVLLQFVLSLTVPLLAALYPILSMTKITVREAISNYGISENRFGSSLIDKQLGRIHSLPRPIMLSLRNTFRRKGRLVLTLITLVLASAIFMAVASVYASLSKTLDQALNYYGFDVAVFFNHPYRTDQIAQEVARAPGVALGEIWGETDLRLLRPDGTESDNILFVAPPIQTQLIHPSVIQGRWLLPEDQGAVVLNTDVIKDNAYIQVGDDIELKIEGKKTTWKVVGIVQSVLIGPWAYTTYPYFAQRLDKVGLASAVYIATDQHDPQSQRQAAIAVKQQFDGAGLRVSSTSLVSDLRSTVILQFNVLIIFLLIMAGVLATVGALGLTGTMGINVLERTREIGVMRAIGASNGAVLSIVIFEGMVIGVLSWLLGVIFSIPLSVLLSDAVGVGFLQTPLDYTFSIPGTLLWFALILVITAIASFVPAQNAMQLTVHDVLLYE